MPIGESFDMNFVNYTLVPRYPRWPISAPGKCGVNHYTFKHAGSAVAAVKRQKPGLILADVQLADDSSGISAVLEILGLLNVPIVFITAYPERFLTGEHPEPAFLISKPFRDDMVKAVISQALFFDQKASLPRAMAQGHGKQASAG